MTGAATTAGGDGVTAGLAGACAQAAGASAAPLATSLGVWGPSGMGKTQLAASLLADPAYGPTAYVDVDGGRPALAGYEAADLLVYRPATVIADVVKTIRERLMTDPVLLQLPIGAESDFLGVVDLVDFTDAQHGRHIDRGTRLVADQAHLGRRGDGLDLERRGHGRRHGRRHAGQAHPGASSSQGASPGHAVFRGKTRTSG